MGGLILAAPSSGSGKTTVTLGVLRALRRSGHLVRSAKSGPDYIDPQFHAAATGQPCVNLDAWGMSDQRIISLAAGPGDLVVEGAMGLFDGAPPDGRGAAADLARLLSLPVVLVVNCAAMSQSVAAVVRGFASHDPDVRIGGVILNNVGSPRHGAMLRRALAPLAIPVFGHLPRSEALSRPSRHLGLVQAGEMSDLEAFIETAADHAAEHLDLAGLHALMATAHLPTPPQIRPTPHAPRSIAVARDAAFSFIYPHHIADWTAAGTDVRYFSPLADDSVPNADEVFLPGGYPELYAGQIAGNQNFMQSLRKASESSDIYGECGGYMTLGETLIDADGTAHKMAGLLGLSTSFADRQLSLGYRTLSRPDQPDGPLTTAHEFHYATTLQAEGTPLWQAWDAENTDLGPTGLREGRVAGSFMHVIDRAP